MTGPSDRLSTPPDAHPFSRPLAVDDVPGDGLARAIEADASECDGVARDIGLPAVRRLVAHYKLTWRSGRLRVEGTVEASITQICVVTLEPFDSDVTQAIDIAFAPAPPPEPEPRPRNAIASRRRSQAAEHERVPPRSAPAPVHIAEGEEDPPDPITDGRIDLGAVAVEFLALSLDIYPRKPGVHFSDVVVNEEDEKPSAFAALARLKDRS